MSEVNILAVKIDAVYPHPNADKLDIIIIGAYQTCDAKGKHQIGDIVAHFPPDILIPLKIAADLGITNYLKDAIYPGDAAKTKCRVGAIRLRGVASFGFVLSVKAEVGDDLTDRFYGVKYEPPEHNWCNRGDNAKGDVRFHTYTDIQNYRNPKYHNALLEGTPVRLTEKLHGCLIAQTRIRMADGGNKHIREIQPGEFVVGYKNGQPVPSKVLKVWKNGKSDNWLKIQFPRNRAGRGSSVGSITCTPNHQFLQEDGSYKEASDLQLGDSVNLLRCDHLPDPGQSYKQAFIWQPITSIMSINKSQQRWDLETETHNYLPSSIVTHNSNSRVGIIDGQYMCGSHTCAKKETFDGEPTRSIYWKPLTDNMKDMLRCIAANGQNVIAFGEIYGSKVQFMDYGVFGSDGYALFDISVNGQYLNWDEVVYYATRFCVPLVPLLYKGPFNHELVNHLVDGQTTIGDLVQMRSKFKGREGLVITPLIETHSDILGGRLILKAISVDYLECRKSDSH